MTKQKPRPKTLVPRRVTVSGSTRPDILFRGLLELVNLAPPEFDLDQPLQYPDAPDSGLSFREAGKARMMGALAKLPDGLRAHLLEVWHQTGEFSAVIRYGQIRAWRRNLRKLIDEGPPLDILIEARVALDERSRAIISYYDQFAATIQGLDLTYLRECPICRHIFFAKKSNQPTCGEPKHAANYRKQRERENKKTREELAERKKKRAKTARKR
jgi:hypothetical protein